MKTNTAVGSMEYLPRYIEKLIELEERMAAHDRNGPTPHSSAVWEIDELDDWLARNIRASSPGERLRLKEILLDSMRSGNER